ncbi:MAG: GLPGLI family protein [Flavobacteriales bacterium]
MISKAGIKGLVLILCLAFQANSQYMLKGKITFERRTNLEKKFTDQRMRRMVTEENKIRTEAFTLYFNDTASVFKAVPTDKVDDMAWMTTKNSYYQNLKTGKQLTVLGLMGQNVYVSDSLPKRNWKITDSKRSICGYECRKAVYQKNDSTRIYAWYTTALVPSVGPEGFCGLPGTILGLATEDGGIIYFAKKIEEITPSKEDMTIETGKNKVFTLNELRQKIEKDYATTPWGKRMFEDLFRWL